MPATGDAILAEKEAPMPDEVIISADSHMTEPPDLWVKRIDQPFRDRAPRVVREHGGKPGHWFVCEGLEPRSVAGTFAAGKSPEELAAFQKSGYEGARPGGWDPVERLKDMAIDGVAAEVLYTTLGFRLFGLSDARFRRPSFAPTTTGWPSSVRMIPNDSPGWP